MYEKNQASVGETVRVLCDGISKNDENTYSGRTEGNKIVFFDAEEKDCGTFVNIRIQSAESFAMRGEIV
jgi:tRNA-2-methylthio-N6-dimethylallyladenosine synthase